MTDTRERLFVAIPVPEPVAQALATLQPAPGEGIRLTESDNTHLTLHFLGERNVAHVSEVLDAVRARPFEVRLGRTGHFSLRGHKTVLWVDVEPEPRLLALHAAVGFALAATGFTVEVRPYRPHITVARLGPGVPSRITARFEERSLTESLRAFECRSFALYASQTRPEGAHYRVVESWPLAGSD